MAHPLTSRCAGPSRTPSSLVRTEPDDLYGSKDPGRGQRRTASQEKVWDGLRPRETKRGMAARGRKAYWQWPSRTDRHWDCGGGARADRIQKQIPKNTVQGRIRVKKLGFSKRLMPELIAPRQPPRCWPAMSCLDGVNVSEAIGCARRSRRPSRPATDTRLLVCCATSLQARLARQCKGERDVAKYRPETWKKLCSPLTCCVCPCRLEAPSLPQDHSIRFAPAPFPFSYATSCRSSRWCRPASVRASAGADSALCVLQYVCLSS